MFYIHLHKERIWQFSSDTLTHRSHTWVVRVPDWLAYLDGSSRFWSFILAGIICVAKGPAAYGWGSCPLNSDCMKCSCQLQIKRTEYKVFFYIQFSENMEMSDKIECLSHSLAGMRGSCEKPQSKLKNRKKKSISKCRTLTTTIYYYASTVGRNGYPLYLYKPFPLCSFLTKPDSPVLQSFSFYICSS